MRPEVQKKCRSCGMVRSAAFVGECDSCFRALEWWLAAETGESTGCWLMPCLEEYLAARTYDQILSTLKPIEAFLAEPDRLLALLSSTRDLHAADLLRQARECLRRAKFDNALALCKTLQAEYPAQAEACGRLRRDICAALIRRGKTAIAESDFPSALEYAQKAIKVEPRNADAERLRTEANARVRLRDLAFEAWRAYKAKNLMLCDDKCRAFLAYQGACGYTIELEDGGRVIDLNALPGRLRAEIEAEHETERVHLAAMASARRYVRLRRIFGLAGACVAVLALTLAISHQRQVRFRNRVASFDGAMRTQSYEAALAIASKIGNRHPPAADLLAYFHARASFEAALSKADTVALQKSGTAKWSQLQSGKKAAEARVSDPAKGIDAYRRALLLLAECSAETDIARALQEARDRTAAEEEARQQLAERERRMARVRGDARQVVSKMGSPESTRKLLLAFDDASRREWCSTADEGLPEGQLLVGWCCETGVDRPKDTDAALAWYRKAAKAGSAPAQMNAGFLLYDQGTRANDDRTCLVEAAQWLRSAADSGLVQAQCLYGYQVYYGTGVGSDHAEGIKWLRKAAEQGSTMAQDFAGHCYLYGDGVERDVYEAARWLKLAASGGVPRAQCSLGAMYFNGEGVNRDTAEGLRWSRLAAEQGDANAQFNMGVQYDNGYGVARNYAEAAKWYRLAAEQGDPEARRRLAELTQQR